MKLKYKLISLITLLSSGLGVIHLINKVISLKAKHNTKTDSENMNTYTWNLGDINYASYTNNKKPLLILHDISVTSSCKEWLAVAKKLTKNHSVYIPDLIGCGQSSKPNTTYNSYIYTQLISDFTKDNIKGICDVIAYGKSSESIIEVLALNPDKFDKVILISPTTLDEKPAHKLSKLFNLILNTPVIGTFIYNLIVSKNNIQNNLTKKVSHKYFISESLIELYYNNAHIGKSPKALYRSLLSNYMSNNSKQSLANLNHSISILYGKKDKEGLFNKDMYNYINRNVESFSIERAKLMPHIENPNELVNAIETYLA